MAPRRRIGARQPVAVSPPRIDRGRRGRSRCWSSLTGSAPDGGARAGSRGGAGDGHRDRERPLPGRASPDGAHRRSTSKPAGGSRGCTRSRTSSTWATSTTSARSTAPTCGATDARRRGCWQTGRWCWELEISYRRRACPPGWTTDLRPRPQTVALSIKTVVRLVRGNGRIEFGPRSTTRPRTIGSGWCSPSGTPREPFAPRASLRSSGDRWRRPSRERNGCEPPDATQTRERSCRARSDRADNQGPSGIRGARRHRRLGAVPDNAALRRLDFAPAG